MTAAPLCAGRRFCIIIVLLVLIATARPPPAFGPGVALGSPAAASPAEVRAWVECVNAYNAEQAQRRMLVGARPPWLGVRAPLTVFDVCGASWSRSPARRWLPLAPRAVGPLWPTTEPSVHWPR